MTKHRMKRAVEPIRVEKGEVGTSLIGSTIRKTFGKKGTFEGEVESFKHPYYKISYEDGDSEDMTRAEVMRYLKTSEESTQNKHPNKKSRGRPKKSETQSREEREGTKEEEEEEETEMEVFVPELVPTLTTVVKEKGLEEPKVIEAGVEESKG